MDFLAVAPELTISSRTGEVSRQTLAGAVELSRSVTTTLVLTLVHKVPQLLKALRACIQSQKHDKIAGSLFEHEWMAPCLDIVVATPDEARGFPASSGTLLILIDDAAYQEVPGFHSVALRLVYAHFRTVSGKESLPPPELDPSKFRWLEWFSPPSRARASCTVQRLVASTLPEAWSCPGRLDQVATQVMDSFACNDNVVCQGWSGVLALLPCLVREAVKHASNEAAPLLLAPDHHRLLALTQLLGCCAQEMGVSVKIGPGAHSTLRVEKVGDVEPPVSASRLVVVEADSILEAHPEWAEFIASFGGCVGLHVTHMTSAVEGVHKRFARKAFVPRPPGVTLDVCHFYALAEGKKKLDLVCDLWEQLQRGKPDKFSVFCNAAETVAEVAKAMVERGHHAYAIYTAGDPILQEVYERSLSIVVTNVYVRGRQDVINYDLPASDEDYLERVGIDRNHGRRFRLVINLATREELQQALPASFQSMEPLPPIRRDLCKNIVIQCVRMQQQAKATGC
ncbi:hypothetical protein SELMODRAFT_427344 [Selaginella moellendorffii]|uniref:Helicase C-terminal domain-containing protein n=1 Tax=Selaginella moellendorffii TaxID=88036 RepID=D8SZA1_SELML|nr:hypothetical protein SELMODRAFT_427344 [Selaginella moellendorffii]